jgi:hypothetical protein
VAFGIERWLLALLAARGVNADWELLLTKPDRIYATIELGI